METSIARTSALPPAGVESSPYHTACQIDVQTTNWNAAKILAAQHHIPISLLESIRDTVISQSAQLDASHDFGAETPFQITASRLPTGRVVFRFRSRQSGSALSPDFGARDARNLAASAPQDGMPRSSSSGAIFTQPGSDPVESIPSAQRGNLGSNFFRKTGNLSPKQSKSIPVLRRKASSNFGPNPFGNLGTAPTPSLHVNQGVALQHPKGPVQPLDSTFQGNVLHPYRRVGNIATLMSRTGSSPVPGPHAKRYTTDHIEEGDVLGAVLGLGQADLRTTSPFDAVVAHAQPSNPSQTRHRRSSSSSSDASSSARQTQPPELHLPELSFDSGSSRSSRLHQLREAQSFESNASDATARGEDKQTPVEQYPAELQPFLRSAMSRSSTYDSKVLIFDVIQCYRRPLPAFDSLEASTVPLQEGLLSAPVLSSNNGSATGGAHHVDFISQAQSLPTTAAPGDDPRFAVWAVKRDDQDGTFVISNREGQTDTDQARAAEYASSAGNSPASTTKRRNRRSNKPLNGMSSSEKRLSGVLGASSPASERPADDSQTGSPRGKAVLLAASAARLIAELTSEIDVTLRSDFFFTFREFMTPLELLELLILRFEWAISEPSSAGDEARRRIVRVRTYVVIKHWLQNHFEFDFLPNRALRQRLAAWLNTIAKDERIADRPADLNIVNGLRKIVRGLKETYSRSGVGGLLLHDSGRLIDSSSSSRKTDSLSTFGSSSYDTQPSIARSTTTASSDEPTVTSSGSASSLVAEDVNLDFSDDPGSHDSQVVRSPPLEHNLNVVHGVARPEPAEATRSAQKAAAESVLVPHRHTLAPSSLAPPPRPSASSSIGSSPAPLPHPSNAWSRAFVQTVGRLSKFKRVLNNRGLGLDAHHELDTEAEECSDILFMKGGLDSLLQYFAIDQATRNSMSAQRLARNPRQRPLSLTEEATEDEEEGLISQASEDSTGQEETPSLGGASTNRSTPASSVDLTGLSDKHTGHEAADSQGLGIIQHVEETVDLSGNDVVGLDANPIRPLGSLVRSKVQTDEHLHHVASEQTLRSVPRASLDRPSADAAFVARGSSLADQSAPHKVCAASIRDSIMSNGKPRVVQIDDVDLSSDEDDFAVRKALRRLPGARDLRQANNIKDLEPQLPPGRESVDSMASSMFRHPASARQIHMGSFGLGHARGLSTDSAMFVAEQLMPPAPPMITTVQTELLDPDEALQGYELVKGFRLDDLESDDEEPGDVEAALRRLEGIIDEDRQREKAKRVERLWQRSLARNATKDAVDQEGEQSADQQISHLSLQSNAERISSSYAGGSVADAEDEASNASAHPCDRSADEPSRPHHKASASPKKTIRAQASFLDLQDSSSASEAEDVAEERRAAMPVLPPRQSPTKRPNSVKDPVTLSGAVPRHSSSEGRPFGQGMLIPPSAGLAARPPVHRSFLLAYRSESIARQMCLIEAELLRSVSWDELTSSRWRERRFGAEVTDWEAFYRDRVRDRLEVQRLGGIYQERAVEAIVARFNLTSNWVASEVVLTQNIEERAAVIAKLIRVAWKCYLQSNFASLAQIIFGLSTPWVARLRRTWTRVGYFEMRMWRDLNSFVGPRNNFGHLRNAMLQLVESVGGVSEGSGGGSRAGASESSRGCIPFFGLFVSDLMQYDAMPTFLDPTAPAKPACTSTVQDGKVRLLPAEPNAFKELAPLPLAVQLEPLINVLKFRSIAEVVRQISAFQSAAKNYSAMFDAEKGAYVRCLKLRCLPGELLAKLSHLIEP